MAPSSALQRWRREKDCYFKTSPDSPIQDAEFTGLAYYPEDLAYVLEASLEPFAHPETVGLMTSVGDEQLYLRYARVRFELKMGELAGEAGQLTLFLPVRGAGSDTKIVRFFFPFRDASSGTETYGAGRYLEAENLEAEGEATAKGRVRLDFNYAYNPLCALSARYRCPLPPAENQLSVPVRAGERCGA